MTNVREQEDKIDYLDQVGTTDEGGLSIEHEGITYTTDDEAMITIDGTTYTMEELNNYEQTKQTKPQIAKAIKTAKDAKRYYDYLKRLSQTRINIKIEEQKKKKKLEELKDPNYFTRKIKDFVNGTKTGFSSIVEKNKNSKSAYIIGILTAIFTTYLFYTFFKLSYITQYFHTFLFLFKRLFFFIILMILIVFTYTIIIKYVPWVLTQIAKYILLTANPLSNDTVNRRYEYWKQWKVAGSIYLGCAYIYYAVITLFLFLFFCFILSPVIVLLGYFIGVSLSFMDD
jgi:hypothetical protein